MVSIELEEGSMVGEIFDKLRIDDREIGFLLRNDEKIQKDAALRDGDLIHFFSFAAGG
jgi:molybdopterin converting factor small subunit